jgi:tetratricopeptide (TPR) repeat protein
MRVFHTAPMTFSVTCLLSLITLYAMPQFVPVSMAATVPKSVEWHEKARTALRNNQYEEAAKATQQAITYDSYDPLLYITLGQVYQKQGLLDKAIEAYNRAAQLNAKDASIYYTLGTLYEQQGEYDKALSSFDISYSKNPNYTYVLSRKARILGFQKRYPEATSLYETYLNSTPRDAEAHRQLARFAVAGNTPQKAVAHLLYIKQQSPELYSDEALLARAYLMMNEPSNALKELNAAEANGRYSAEVADLKSRAYESLGQVKEAIQQLNVVTANASQIQPDEAGTYHYRLAALKAQSGEYGDALNHLNVYLKSTPTDVGARLAEITWLNKLNRYSDAQKAIQTLRGSSLQLTQAQQREFNTQQAFSLLQTGQYNEAANLYYTLLKDTPPQDDSYITLLQNKAVALYKANRYDDALFAFRQLLDSGKLNEPETRLVQTDMVNAYMAQGKKAIEAKELVKAEQLFEQAKALAKTPESLRNLQLELGALYYDSERTTEAIAQYEGVLQQDPNNTEAKLNLGRLLLEGNPQRAIELLAPVTTDVRADAETTRMAKRLLADAYLKTGQQPDALRLLEGLVTSKEGNTQVSPQDYMQLAALYHQTNNYGAAESYYQKALALQPNFPLASFNLGSLYMLQKKYPQAKLAMQTAIKGDAPVAKAYYALGLLEDSAKQYDAAYLYFHEYLKRANDISATEKTAVQQRIQALAPKVKKETATQVFQRIQPSTNSGTEATRVSSPTRTETPAPQPSNTSTQSVGGRISI